MTNVMNVEQDTDQRIKELMRKKKKLNATIRRGRKIQIKARVEKKKVNEELRLLKGKASIFRNMTSEQAAAEVRRRIEGVRPKDVYPADLERTFDRLEAPSNAEHKVVDLGKIPERPVNKIRHGEDDAEVVGDAEVDEVEAEEEADEGVVDLSEQ